MNWREIFDFRLFAILQGLGFVAEFLAYRFNSKKIYPWREARRSLLIAVPAFVIWGIEIEVIWIFSKWLAKYRFFNLDPTSPIMLVVTFLLAEFHFYVTHYLQHQVNWMWADHQVHHSSTDLNIFDGNRLGWSILLAGGFNTLFLPLVLLGFDAGILIACSSGILFFQFFIHTQAIPRLGFLDSIFNTPSNHRVHHASNIEYLDSNYGGVTVIFDRIFGTYIPEKPGLSIRYGLWEHEAGKMKVPQVLCQGWKQIFLTTQKCKSLGSFLKSFLGPPGWSPDCSTLTTSQLRAVLPMNKEDRF